MKRPLLRSDYRPAGPSDPAESLVLYHSVESACAQKVRLVLSEKGLQWTEYLLNLRKGEQFAPEYLKLNPKAVVPTLVHQRQVIRESTVINEYLDHAFPDPPLKPREPAACARMRLLVKTFDDDVHPAIGVLTYALVMRHQMDALKSPAELEAHFQQITDPMRRERQRNVHQAGVKSPAARLAVTTLSKVMQGLDAALEEGPWLAGQDYSLADVAAAPYVARMEGLQLSELCSARPSVREWLQRVRDRENCRELHDPWGSTAFAAMMAGYAERARPDVAALFNAPESHHPS